MMGGETESCNFPGLNTILIYNITHMSTYVLVYPKDNWDTVLLLIYIPNNYVCILVSSGKVLVHMKVKT